MEEVPPMLLTKSFIYWARQVFSSGHLVQDKYEAFRSLLGQDKRAHELMAELEEIYHNQLRVDFTRIENLYHELSRCVSGMAKDLNEMRPSRYHELKSYFKKLDSYARFIFESPAIDTSPPFTFPLNKIPPEGLPQVGAKAFRMARLKRELELPIPRGYVLTKNAFHRFVAFNNLREKIDKRLSDLDIQSTRSLNSTSHDIMERVLEAQMPPEVEAVLRDAFDAIQETAGDGLRVAIRSSAVGEDTQATFAGQYKSILNVGREGVADAYREILASKYAPEALYYRISYGLSDRETPMAVLMLEMIDATASGIVYTTDLDGEDPEIMNIHSIWGLGELLVGGRGSPDVISVVKEQKPQIHSKRVGMKTNESVLDENGFTKTIPVDAERRHSFSLDDASAQTLAEYALRIEAHYGEPQDIEWCMAQDHRLYVLQSRPLRSEEWEVEKPECDFKDIMNAVLITGGDRACGGIGAGKAYIVRSESDLDRLPVDAVLVARDALPQYVKVMDRLSAVVTDVGSTAGHFSSVAREFGVPTLVNTGNATEKLPMGREMTVYADANVVYDGIVEAMLDSPCAQRDLLRDSPFARKLQYLMRFVSHLELVDPREKSFVAEKVRSLHDIIRFCHEKALLEMFHIGDKRIRKIGGSKKLLSKIPMLFYVLDVGGGLREDLAEEKAVRMEDITSSPMQAVLRGLTHPDIRWGDFTHFDWAEFDKMVMSGGIISPESAVFASYAILARDYLNLNLRFGYHFVILDVLCGDNPADNYVLFRFAGGGADIDQRSLRADFLKGVLERLGFEVDKKWDLVDGRLQGEGKEQLEQLLDWVGRLLGATRLMDMYLKDNAMVADFVEDFMNGRYHFASVE